MLLSQNLKCFQSGFNKVIENLENYKTDIKLKFKIFTYMYKKCENLYNIIFNDRYSKYNTSS